MHNFTIIQKVMTLIALCFVYSALCFSCEYTCYFKTPNDGSASANKLIDGGRYALEEEGVIYGWNIVQEGIVYDTGFKFTPSSTTTKYQLTYYLKFVVPNGHYVYVRDYGTTQTALSFWTNITLPSTSLTANKNFITATTRPVLGEHASDFIYTMRAKVPKWSVPRDLIAYAKRPGYNDGKAFDRSSSARDGSGINIGQYDYAPITVAGTTSGNICDIYHECAHWLHSNLPGGVPPFAVIDPHNAATESSPECAITEAWAEYVSSICYIESKNNISSKANTDKWWRGYDFSTYSYGTGSDNSGEYVEGAIWRTWHYLYDSQAIINTFMLHNPSNYREWLEKYLIAVAGNQNKVSSVFSESQKNGIVYTRGKITGFSESGPNNSIQTGGTIDIGNTKVIDDIMYIRGEVNANASQCTKSDLNLQTSIIAAQAISIRYKNAVAGSNENVSSSSFLSYFPQKTISGSYVMDTTSKNDGEYDIIAQLQNDYGFWDDFNPDFTGDADNTRNSDEKWLKSLRTWYYQGTLSAGTNPDDDKGKVVFDNTAPKVSDTFPPAN